MNASAMSSNFQLPSSILSYLKRLKIEYDQSDRFLSQIVTSKVFVREHTIGHDNWNSGAYVYGHDVLFFLPDDVFKQLELKKEKAYREKIRKDLKKCNSFEDEFFNEVFFEVEDENDREYQRAVSLSKYPQVEPDALSIWQPGQIRLFVSHRDEHKKKAKDLAEALEGYGISAFLAHDGIEPTAKWQNEILKGLETMEVMLVFVTDDLHESEWTNQEIGFALGRRVPILSLKLEGADPKGFIGSEQALKGDPQDPAASASLIYKLVAKKLDNKGRLQSALISAFTGSSSFEETKKRFDRLNEVVDSISEEEAQRIIDGFKENDQLHGAYYLNNKYKRLINFLERTTGRECSIVGRNIISRKSED